MINLGLGPEVKFYYAKGDYTAPSFTGRSKNLLFEILKSNDYSIYTGFPTAHFGKLKGPLITNYKMFNRAIVKPSEIVASSLSCQVNNSFLKIGKFYNLCDRLHIFNQMNNKFFEFDASNENLDEHTFVMNYIINSNKNPKLFIYHFGTLIGHVSDTFDYKAPNDIKKFRDSYKQGLDKVNKSIEHFIDYINVNDPDAIVIFMGDHGIWFRTFQDNNIDEINPQSDYINQTLATKILLQKTKNECSNINKLNLASKKYLHITDVVAGIINCLEGNEFNFFDNNFFDQSIWFKNNKRAIADVDDRDILYIDLNDYLYE